ncbi:hypothetical protein BH09PLA1_BH09PLA1_18550 [soil metagenome]
MRILKLLAYTAIGYAAYQIMKGMVGADESRGNPGNGGFGDDLDRALNEDPGRMMNMTGPARGTTVSTEDSSGASIPHLVGRGVVRA